MRAVVACGGTGGHVCPGLAVARALAARGVDVRLSGTRRAVESDLVSAGEFGPPIVVGATGLRGRRPVVAKVSSLARAASATWSARAQLRRARPDVVLGLGGYASVPVVFAARTLRVPTAILEPNAEAGLANALLSRFVDLAFVSSSDTFPRMNGRSVCAGVPVRAEFTAAGRAEAARAAAARFGLDADLPIVLVTTGSLGAGGVNRAAADALSQLAREGVSQAIHLTGRSGHSELKARYDGLPGVVCLPLTRDMHAAMAAADVVVCRAGASTLAEIAVCGLPAVIVPSPNVAGRHQDANARAWSDAGAGLVLDESSLDGGALLPVLRGLLGDAGRLRAMGGAARALARPDAADRVADALFDLATMVREKGKRG